MRDLRSARVAIVHEWLAGLAGSEKVAARMCALFPGADLFALFDVLSDEDRRHFGGRHARTSWLQRVPGIARRYRAFLPLMPLAVEQFDLSGYDLILSSHHAVAKGVLTGPDQVHVSYVHSPMRYAWDLQHEYLETAGLARGVRGAFVRAALHYLRMWDVRSVHGVDRYVANSHFIARRIRKTYGREADVVPPPVAVQDIPVGAQGGDYYLAASRMVPYKRLDLVVDAFRELPERRLVVIGDGPQRARIEASAGPNVEFVGHVSDARLHQLLGGARAFLFAAREDFGILPVEAQAAGTPVIAFGAGGVRDSVRELGRPTPTGVFFEPQTPGALADAVRTFEAHADAFDPAALRAHAMTFDGAAFDQAFMTSVEAAWRAVHTDR